MKLSNTGIKGGATTTQVEVYRLLKSVDEHLTAQEIRTALDDGEGWNVQYFCQRLYENGCIQREEFGTRRVYRYWVE
jgi:predicted transcriptional regulator